MLKGSATLGTVLVRRLQIPYRHGEGWTTSFDFFRPEGQDRVPLVALLHGGGWISGDPCMMHDVAESMVSEGYAAACVGYRLAPLYPYPSAVEDVWNFIEYARQNDAELGINGDQIAAMGNSAGGYLAAMAGVARDDAQRANAVIAICPITNIDHPRESHLPISWSFIDQYMMLPYDGNEAVYREASPITHARSGLPPFMVVHGEADDIVPCDQGIQFANALAAADNDVTLLRVPDEGHSFTLPAWNRIEAESIAFLRRVFAVA